ncbi:MAG: FAD-dependent oxidoreductase [Candidatus Latescibacterota bacterium]|nr:FAD-dependent oxidoreductase [Candidatus Latescibacterota bacterium]
MNQSDIAIIGGGISGLGLAHFCAKAGHNVRLFERDSQLGGALQTHNTDGFWFELGGHTCYNSYETLIEILHDLDLLKSVQLRKREPFRIWYNGQFRSIFSQLNKIQLLRSLPRFLWARKDGQTVSTYYGNIAGKNNFGQVLSNVFNAVSSQTADEFPAEILFKKRPRNKTLPRSFTLTNGLQSIAPSIVSHQKIEYKLSCEVTSLRRETDSYSIKTKDGAKYFSKQLALATPPAIATQLLKEISPDLSKSLGHVRFVNVESMAVVIESSNLKIEPMAGAIARDEVFFSIVSRDVIPHEHLRGFTFHFAPDLLSHEEKICRIANLFDISQTTIKSIDEARHILPCFRMGHYEWLAQTDQMLDQTDLLLTGNYFSGMSIEDCLSRSKSQSFRLLQSQK